MGVFPYDAVTEEYIKGRVNRPVEPIVPDADAVYAQTITIDLSKLQPVVAFPHFAIQHTLHQRNRQRY